MKVRNILILTLLLSLIVVNFLSGADYYVTPGGAGVKDGSSWANACTNISHAVSLASAGDTIYVADGIYTESVTIVNGITLISTNNAIIDGAGNMEALLITGGFNRVEGISCINANDQGLSFAFATSSNNIITNCKFYNNLVRGISIGDNSDYNKIKNCLIYSNAGLGIIIGSANNNIIDNNQSWHNAVGLNLNKNCSSNIIQNNIFYSNSEVGIMLEIVTNIDNVIKNNIAYGNTFGGIVAWKSGTDNGVALSIYSNEIYNDNGIAVSSVENCDVFGNIVSNANTFGAVIINAININFYNNLIYNSTTATGVKIQNSSTITLINNTITNNCIGIAIDTNSESTWYTNGNIIIGNKCGFDVMILTPPLVTAPSTPAMINATGISTNQIDLVWNDLSNETSYTLFRHTLNNSGSASKIAGLAVNITNYNDTGVIAGITYYYWIKAYNSAGASGFSIVKSATPLSDTAAPVTTADKDTASTYWDEIEVTLTAVDSTNSETVSGVDKIYYTTDGSNPTNSTTRMSNTLSTNSVKITIVTTTTLQFYAQDKAGNKEKPQTKIYKIVVDKTPPVTSVDQDTGIYMGEIEVTLTAVDNTNGSGVRMIYYTLDSSNPSNSSTRKSNISPVKVKVVTVSTLQFYAVDNAGNAEVVQSIYYEILLVPDDDVAIYRNYLDLSMGEPARIVFGKADNAEIKIYTVRGTLVKEYPKQAYVPGIGQEWDGTIKNTGKKAGAGIYIVIVRCDKLGMKKLKMIIKK